VPDDDVVFIVNPASANGSTGRRWPEIANRVAASGLPPRALLSERPGDVVVKTEQAVAAGARTVVAVGGDGTIHEVVNGLLRQRGPDTPALAVLPRGTGGDFVRSIGIPSDLDAAIEIVQNGSTRAVDAGRARFARWDGEDGEAYFANFAGAGISGAIARRANRSSKALGGRISFIWATVAVFARWKNTEVSVAVDGEERRGRMYEILAMNGAYTAGGMWVTPDASPEDGLFDVLLIGNVTKAEFVATFPKVYRGTHLGHPKIELLRGRAVTVDAPSRLPIALDGEQPGTTPVAFEIVPRALRVRVPRA
jgi:diacylglycerol kinase (ATP)